jgi:hypothetical protein
MKAARTKPRASLGIPVICVIATLVLTGLYFKEKRASTDSPIDTIWSQRADQLARMALDVPHYVDTHNLDRNMYTDDEVYRHFIEVGLPNGLEYRLREGVVDEAERIRHFWQERLQESYTDTE